MLKILVSKLHQDSLKVTNNILILSTNSVRIFCIAGWDCGTTASSI
jgi:hypothetical protein